MKFKMLVIDGMDYNLVKEWGVFRAMPIKKMRIDLDKKYLYTIIIMNMLMTGSILSEKEMDRLRELPQRRQGIVGFLGRDYLWDIYPETVKAISIPTWFSPKPFNLHARKELGLALLTTDLDLIDEGAEEFCNTDYPITLWHNWAVDITAHRFGKGKELKAIYEKWDKTIREINPGDKWIIISDHGNPGIESRGVDAHSEDAIFISNFMFQDKKEIVFTELVRNFFPAINELMLRARLEAIGYV